MYNNSNKIGGTTVQPLPQIQIEENPNLIIEPVIQELLIQPAIEEQIPIPEIPINTMIINDYEVRRLSNLLVELINNSGINKSRLLEFSQSLQQQYQINIALYPGTLLQPPLILDNYNISENNILSQIDFYVKMATNPDINKRRSFNFHESIVVLENTIQDVLIVKYNIAREQDRRNQSIGGFVSNPNQNVEKIFSHSIPLGKGSIGGIFSSILSIYCETYGGNPSIQTVRKYCNLLLTLYTRIQNMLNENGFQQGGKKFYTNKKKYKNKKTRKNNFKNKKNKRKRRTTEK